MKGFKSARILPIFLLVLSALQQPACRTTPQKSANASDAANPQSSQEGSSQSALEAELANVHSQTGQLLLASPTASAATTTLQTINDATSPENVSDTADGAMINCGNLTYLSVINDPNAAIPPPSAATVTATTQFNGGGAVTPSGTASPSQFGLADSKEKEDSGIGVAAAAGAFGVAVGAAAVYLGYKYTNNNQNQGTEADKVSTAPSRVTVTTFVTPAQVVPTPAANPAARPQQAKAPNAAGRSAPAVVTPPAVNQPPAPPAGRQGAPAQPQPILDKTGKPLPGAISKDLISLSQVVIQAKARETTAIESLRVADRRLAYLAMINEMARLKMELPSPAEVKTTLEDLAQPGYQLTRIGKLNNRTPRWNAIFKAAGGAETGELNVAAQNGLNFLEDRRSPLATENAQLNSVFSRSASLVPDSRIYGDFKNAYTEASAERYADEQLVQFANEIAGTLSSVYENENDLISSYTRLTRSFKSKYLPLFLEVPKPPALGASKTQQKDYEDKVNAINAKIEKLVIQAEDAIRKVKIQPGQFVFVKPVETVPVVRPAADIADPAAEPRGFLGAIWGGLSTLFSTIGDGLHEGFTFQLADGTSSDPATQLNNSLALVGSYVLGNCQIQ